MSGSGRFGKYGDYKRALSLRQSRKTSWLRQGCSWFRCKDQGFIKKISPYYNNIQIDNARPGHLKFIVDLSKRLFSVYGEYGEPVRLWFISKDTVSLVARFKGQMAGFIMMGTSPLNQKDPVSREILAIGVHPRYQRKGIGGLLLQMVERQAIEMNIPRIYLHTARDNMVAKRLFIRMGYKNMGVRSGFYPNGQSAILMCKDVSL